MRKAGRFLRKHAIEATVVILILGLLLVVMIPPFLKAQGRARAVRAMYDLERIAKAMHTLERDGEFLDVVYIEKEKEGGAWHSGSRGAAFMKLFDLLGNIPVPIRTTSLPGMVDSPGRYEVATGAGRLTSNTLQLIPYMALCPMQSFNFSQVSYRSIVGASFGPFYDERLIQRVRAVNQRDASRPPSLRFLDSITPRPSYFATYDPTNGAISHGFIVLITEKGPPLTPQARRLEDEMVRQRMERRGINDIQEAMWNVSSLEASP